VASRHDLPVKSILMSGFYRSYGKRALDLIIVIPALIILSPLLLIVATCVGIFLGSPVLFKQKRSGKDEEEFSIFKFRTMTEARDEKGELLNDTVRLTRFGNFLRASSLDELPQLFNVLLGQMSLVGPRPFPLNYTPYFTEEERVRFTVLPGISGLAQVSGRNDLDWDRRIQYDVEYVRTMSLPLDLRILGLTFKKVFKREGLQVDAGAVRLNFDAERKLRAEKAPEAK